MAEGVSSMNFGEPSWMLALILLAEMGVRV